MRAVEFSTPVESGMIPRDVARAIAEVIRKAEGKRLHIRIAEERRKRTTRQNAFFFGVVVPAVKALFREYGTLLDDEEVFDFLKREVGGLKRIVADPSGVRHSVLRSSTTLTAEEWEAWTEAVRAWAAPFGVRIPFPNEPPQQLLY